MIPQQVERTFCDCRRCTAFCRTMPGDLAPGDIDRIADYLGVEATEQFVQANFRAASGRTIPYRGGEADVPTIVPAQRPDGRCVFFTADERCAIHPVAPFGCSRFNYCDEPDHEDHRRMRRLLKAIVKAEDYVLTWARLKMAQRTVPPLKDRLAHFAAEAGPPITREP
jgi:Fe-S-cluster containining protein